MAPQASYVPSSGANAAEERPGCESHSACDHRAEQEQAASPVTRHTSYSSLIEEPSLLGTQTRASSMPLKTSRSAGAVPTRRAVTLASALPSSLVFQTASQQSAGPVLANAELPAGSAILLPNKGKDSAVLQEVFTAHLRKALTGLVSMLLAIIGSAVAVAWLCRGHWASIAALWLAIEAVFAVWLWQHAVRLDAQPQPHRPAHNDPVLHFKRLVAHAKFFRDVCGRALDWRSYVSKWFKNTPPEDVRMENLKEMIGYGFMYSTREQLQRDGSWSVVEEMAAQLSELSAPPTTHTLPHTHTPTHTATHGGPIGATEAAGAATNDTATDNNTSGCVRLEEGYAEGLSYMAHLWEPLRWHFRPLAFYLIIEALHCLTWGALTALGFRWIVVDGTTFYYRPGLEGSSPLVFLHGVGLGLLPYLVVIVRLSASGLPLLMYEARHVSMRLCHTVPTACDMADRVVKAMDRLQVTQGCVMAHSYGTFVASRLVQKHSQRAVRSLALVDPVCFGMFLPSLLANFIYRNPYQVWLKSGIRKAIRNSLIYLVSRDVHAAATFCRRFYWTDVNLWAEDLPQRSLIVLAGADELLHADEVRMVVSGAYVGVPRGPQPLTYDSLMNKSTTNMAITTADATHTGSVGAVPPPARVLYHPTCGHADWLLNTTWQAEVVEQILSLALGENVLHHVARRATAQPYTNPTTNTTHSNTNMLHTAAKTDTHNLCLSPAGSLPHPCTPRPPATTAAPRASYDAYAAAATPQAAPAPQRHFVHRSHTTSMTAATTFAHMPQHMALSPAGACDRVTCGDGTGVHGAGANMAYGYGAGVSGAHGMGGLHGVCRPPDGGMVTEEGSSGCEDSTDDLESVAMELRRMIGAGAATATPVMA